MNENGFRPWGLLPWVLQKIKTTKWSTIGCISTEERCLASLEALHKKVSINKINYYEIIDQPSEYFDECKTKRELIKDKFLSTYGHDKDIKKHYLLESSEIIVECVSDFIESSGDSVILDITSFPKRFFFPIVKILLDEKKFKNIIVTYTVPEKYHEGELAQDPDDWQHIPLFMPVEYPEPETDLAIVGIGFLPFGLPDLLKDNYSNVDVKLFFPFPPGPPNYQRTWEFVRKIEKPQGHESANQQILRINAVDVSDTYNHILSLTNNSNKNVIFAPYGPKPLSLAMCIYACKTGSPVFYTQPHYYHPDYSTGIKIIDGEKQTFAYCIRLNDIDYYSIES